MSKSRTSEFIKVAGDLTFEDPPESLEDVQHFMNQIATDAVCGTFGEFPPYFKNRWEKRPSQWASANARESTTKGIYEFKLQLSADLFGPELAGLQHLIGVLAGDLFDIQVSGFGAVKSRVSSIKLPSAFEEESQRRYRTHANSIEDIRMAFQLQPDEPLLAFSFKPRVGLKLADLKEITLGVLDSGFHLVELDTRNLMLDSKAWEVLRDLSKRATELKSRHVARFSPNLSIPFFRLGKYLDEHLQQHASEKAVIKIDGGLDGLSSCQAVRSVSQYQTTRPIITCYPLFRQRLAPLIPPDFYVKALSLSGADIIYPGGRPRCGDPKKDKRGRTIWPAPPNLTASVRRYHEFVSQEWPMPTVAGGIHAGELHAYYELLGPDVAFFLGGAVALHKKGPIEGAKLCKTVITEAIEKRKHSPEAIVPPLPDRLVEQIESAYSDDSKELTIYAPPRDLLAKLPELAEECLSIHKRKEQ